MKSSFYRIACLCLLILSLNVSVFAQEDKQPLPNVGGVDHLGLSVLNLDASTEFFTKVLGFRVGGEDPNYPAKFLSNGEMFLTLWQVNEPGSAVRFNRKNNVGLHHLALRVASFEALDTLYQVISKWEGAEVEFSPELAYGGPAKHMMIREPSGNRLELVHRPAQ